MTSPATDIFLGSARRQIPLGPIKKSKMQPNAEMDLIARANCQGRDPRPALCFALPANAVAVELDQNGMAATNIQRDCQSTCIDPNQQALSVGGNPLWEPALDQPNHTRRCEAPDHRTSLWPRRECLRTWRTGSIRLRSGHRRAIPYAATNWRSTVDTTIPFPRRRLWLRDRSATPRHRSGFDTYQGARRRKGSSAGRCYIRPAIVELAVYRCNTDRSGCGRPGSVARQDCYRANRAIPARNGGPSVNTRPNRSANEQMSHR